MKYVLLSIIISISNVVVGQTVVPVTEEGSMTSLLKYFYKTYKHPQYAKEKKIEGYFTVDFYVNNEGQIQSDSIKVKSMVCKECDDLALKILKESPKGLTGHQNTWILNFGFTLTYKKVTVPDF